MVETDCLSEAQVSESFSNGREAEITDQCRISEMGFGGSDLSMIPHMSICSWL